MLWIPCWIFQRLLYCRPFFLKLWSIKKICLGFQIVNNVLLLAFFYWGIAILQDSFCSVCVTLFPTTLTNLYFSLSSGSEELKRMAHSKARAADGKVTYPPGVKEISDKISKEEMVRRLKVSPFMSFCLRCIISVYWVVRCQACLYDHGRVISLLLLKNRQDVCLVLEISNSRHF